MICYADSSFLVAWFHPADPLAVPVTDWTRAQVTDFVWNPILRAEVRHNLRKLKSRYARTAWNAYRACEKTRRLVLNRQNVMDLLNAGDDLSAERASEISAGTWDFVHVAAFLDSKAHYFATLDKLQAELAFTFVPKPRVKLFAE
jgi:predicted nucleic acid-binding protein